MLMITEVRKSTYWKSTFKTFESSKKYQFGFQVTTPTRTYHFRARNEKDMDMWIYGLSSIAGLEANHVCKWPTKDAGDPPERIIHGAGHGMKAAREKHAKRLQDGDNDDDSDGNNNNNNNNNLNDDDMDMNNDIDVKNMYFVDDMMMVKKKHKKN